jgi:hypothetical protein
MKTKIIAIGLFLITTATVAFYPGPESPGLSVVPNVSIPNIDRPVVDPVVNQPPIIEAVFVLDTTGSMSGLISAAKEKIWSIASTMAMAQQAPEIRIGLVGYRDRGDIYVTSITDLSADLDSVYTTLMNFQADGGGDGPESVNQALYDAVHKISWSQAEDAYRVVFLIGDAPPHMDYQDDVKYPETLSVANSKGITVNTIQAGENDQTYRQWHQIAQLGMGSYFQVEQAGNAVAIATPFDEEIAMLSRKLDETRMYYGSRETRARKAAKDDSTEKVLASATPASRARRAIFNASESGKINSRGDSELVDDIVSGFVELQSLDKEELPEPLQSLALEEQEALIQETIVERTEAQQKIRQLAEARSSYLKTKVESLGGAKDSLDHKLFDAMREQAVKKGIIYSIEEPDY